MKISIDIDCTPDEARAFFGLPELKPMQDALMAQLQDRLRQGLDAADLETLLKTWLPAGVKDWGNMQKTFWAQFTGATGKPGAGSEEDT